jgi:hypothetical protein
VERSDENLWFCEEQILRLEVTRFYDRLTLVGKQELRDALCDSASSKTAAELRVTTWIRLNKDCPSGADFGLMEEAEQREARAQVSWKADPPPTRDGTWTASQRREHDAEWAAFCNGGKNRDLVKGKTDIRKALMSILGKTAVGDEGDERKEPNSAVFVMPAKKEPA